MTNKLTIPIILFISLIGAVFIGYNGGIFDIFRFFISWASLFILTILVIMIQIKHKNSQIFKANKLNDKENINTFNFYENELVFRNNATKTDFKISYDKIYYLVENKDFFIFYFNKNQTSFLNKRDIEDINKFKNFICPKFKNNYKKISRFD
ncbi:hypothetical protein ABID14_001411 [Peptoniphilus olsenii]|uniref:YcxB-like C-terminal domain-containing protein n=1 Tax=Peptoniphilus olsenii TaxID=411570 RepID=A0ABV2JAG2_9FIRM